MYCFGLGFFWFSFVFSGSLVLFCFYFGDYVCFGLVLVLGLLFALVLFCFKIDFSFAFFCEFDFDFTNLIFGFVFDC